jgi:hypothetical protein
LFVIAAGDFEDVAVEFVAKGVSRDFLANLHGMSMSLEGWRGKCFTLLSMKARKRRSSSISMSFWLPLAG